MAEKGKIEILIVKYIEGNLNDQEGEVLSEWLKSSENKKVFEKFLAVNYSIQEIQGSGSELKHGLWQSIKDVTKENKPIKLYWKYAAAASIALLIALSIWFLGDGNLNESPGTIEMVNIESIEPGTHKATLVLEDGSLIQLGGGEVYRTETLRSDDQQIVYDPAPPSANEVEYNYLSVPRGGQYFVQLPDGTKVWLNSDSKLKYPTSFITGHDRVVELEYGEAFFDVSPSTRHQGSKFLVVAPRQTLEVLGTEFNIKAYGDEHTTYTTLVEGKVQVGNSINEERLDPGQQSAISNGDKIVVNHVNVNDVVSWKSGVFSFNGASLKEITQVLSRWYDVDFDFQNSELQEIKFVGVFRKTQPLEQLLEVIQNTNTIKAYEVNDKTIMLK